MCQWIKNIKNDLIEAKGANCWVHSFQNIIYGKWTALGGQIILKFERKKKFKSLVQKVSQSCPKYSTHQVWKRKRDSKAKGYEVIALSLPIGEWLRLWQLWLFQALPPLCLLHYSFLHLLGWAWLFFYRFFLYPALPPTWPYPKMYVFLWFHSSFAWVLLARLQVQHLELFLDQSYRVFELWVFRSHVLIVSAPEKLWI